MTHLRGSVARTGVEYAATGKTADPCLELLIFRYGAGHEEIMRMAGRVFETRAATAFR